MIFSFEQIMPTLRLYFVISRIFLSLWPYYYPGFLFCQKQLEIVTGSSNGKGKWDVHGNGKGVSYCLSSSSLSHPIQWVHTSKHTNKAVPWMPSIIFLAWRFNVEEILNYSIVEFLNLISLNNSFIYARLYIIYII